MKYYMKKISALLIACILVLSLEIGYAHSGRTDSNGGHKDNKNKSGLGSYHYHCGGNPPHLHDNGVCPYSAKAKSSTTSNTKINTTTNSKTVDNDENKPKEINPTSITIKEDIKNMNVDEEIQLTFNIIPEESTNKSVEWESSDDTIAEVNKDGKIIALKEGTVEIKAKTINGKEDTIKITIEENEETQEVNNSVVYNDNKDISNIEKSNIKEEESNPISTLMGATIIGGGCYLGYKKKKKDKEQ